MDCISLKCIIYWLNSFCTLSKFYVSRFELAIVWPRLFRRHGHRHKLYQYYEVGLDSMFNQYIMHFKDIQSISTEKKSWSGLLVHVPVWWNKEIRAFFFQYACEYICYSYWNLINNVDYKATLFTVTSYIGYFSSILALHWVLPDTYTGSHCSDIGFMATFLMDINGEKLAYWW